MNDAGRVWISSWRVLLAADKPPQVLPLVCLDEKPGSSALSDMMILKIDNRGMVYELL